MAKKNPCIGVAYKAARQYGMNKIQATEFVEIFNELAGVVQGRTGDGTEFIAQKVNRYLKSKLAVEALQARRNAILNTTKALQIIDFVKQVTSSGKKKWRHPEDALVVYYLGHQALVRDAEGNIIPMRAGVSQKQAALVGKYESMLGHILKNVPDGKGGTKDLFKFYAKGEFSEEIFLELRNLMEEVPVEDAGRPFNHTGETPENRQMVNKTPKRQRDINEAMRRVKSTGGNKEAAFRQWLNDLDSTQPSNNKLDLGDIDPIGVKNINEERKRRFFKLIEEGEKAQAEAKTTGVEAPEAKPSKPESEPVKALRKKSTYKKRKESVTGVEDARAVAEAIYDVHNHMVKRHRIAGGLNEVDAPWRLHQTHNVARILKAAKGDETLAYQLWREEIVQRIDIEKSFDTIPASGLEEALRERFGMIMAESRSLPSDPIKVGADGRSIPKKGDQTYFIRKSSLAKRGSRDDLFVFKSPADEWAYNQKYGSASLNDVIQSELTYFGQSTALMETLGPDPDGVFTAVMRAIHEMNKELAIPVRKRSGLSINPQEAFDQVMGYLDNPSTPNGRKLAKLLRALKVHQVLSKLGYITISATTDKPQMHFTLTYNGLSHSEAFLAGLSAFKPKTDYEKAVISAWGTAFDYIAGELNSRSFYGGDGPHAGRAYKLQEKMMKAVGMHAWNDAHKGATALALINFHARHADLPFNKLPLDAQHRLGQYGMGAEEWALLAKTATKAEDGRAYFLPENILKLSDNDIMSVNKKFLDKDIKKADFDAYRRDIETKYRTLITDQANEAVITPGSRERILARLGTQKGTWGGELVSALTYFQSFPISITSKILQRELLGFEGQISRRVARQIGLITSTAVMGYLSGAIKDVLNGKTPKTNWIEKDGSPNYTLLMDSIARGGGIGVYTDFLLFQFDNSYKSMAKTAVGPIFGTLFEGGTLLGQGVVGAISKDHDIPDMHNYTNFLKSNTPFGNLPVIKLVTDQLILKALDEVFEPGYARKHKRGLKNKTDQEYWIDEFYDWMSD
jgi:hypothetical protein